MKRDRTHLKLACFTLHFTACVLSMQMKQYPLRFLCKHVYRLLRYRIWYCFVYRHLDIVVISWLVPYFTTRTLFAELTAHRLPNINRNSWYLFRRGRCKTGEETRYCRYCICVLVWMCNHGKCIRPILQRDTMSAGVSNL